MAKVENIEIVMALFISCSETNGNIAAGGGGGVTAPWSNKKKSAEALH